jgi:8-oxo-dGTP pyrophosphatase MutT (NUDIX family)
MTGAPSDSRAPRFPVSVKGVLLFGEQCVLLQNERAEWELPGGKLDPGEQPMTCLAREIEEELGIGVEIGAILDSWLYDIQGKVEVLIVTYGCRIPDHIRPEHLVLSHEHKALGLHAVTDLDGLPMPEGYRRSVRAWHARQRS